MNLDIETSIVCARLSRWSVSTLSSTGLHAFTHDDRERLERDVFRCMLNAHAPLLSRRGGGLDYMPHQCEMMAWSFGRELALDEHGVRGGINADEMGLGKTVSSIALVAGNSKPGQATLILCPKQLVTQWADAFARFAPCIPVTKVRTTSGSPSKADLASAAVFIVQFEAIQIEKKRGRRAQGQESGADREIPPWLLFDLEYVAAGSRKQQAASIVKDEGGVQKRKVWHRVIVDEAHFMRNRKTGLFRGLSSLKARSRWALTATPVQNSLEDLRSILMWLGYSEASLSSDERLCQTLGACMLGRSQFQALQAAVSLPDRTDDVVQVPIDDMTRRIMRCIMDSSSAASADAEEEDDLEEDADFTAAEITKIHLMRRASSNPVSLVFDASVRKRYPGLPTAAQVAASMERAGLRWTLVDPVTQDVADVYPSLKVKMLVEHISSHEEKAIVFIMYHDEAAIVENALRCKGIGCRRFDGKCSAVVKETNLQTFKCAGQRVRVLIVQFKCGAVGLDITEATYAYFLTPDYNPHTVNQAICRIYRLGQTRPVKTVTYVAFCRDDPRLNIEQHCYDKQLQKMELSKVLDNNDPSFMHRIHSITSSSSAAAAAAPRKAPVQKALLRFKKRTFDDIIKDYQSAVADPTEMFPACQEYLARVVSLP